ncbi:MAG: hypothetical protein M0C28_12225 [Candidatus Moduliflexus flocculans]|nr:hypothetical protein [Candidatus Moduliflexus flocculans]
MEALKLLHRSTAPTPASRRASRARSRPGKLADVTVLSQRHPDGVPTTTSARRRGPLHDSRRQGPLSQVTDPDRRRRGPCPK